MSKGYLHSHFGSIIHNSQNMELTFSLHQWVNGFKNVIHIQMECYPVMKKNEILSFVQQMDESGDIV
jgi:hypothetical protein